MDKLTGQRDFRDFRTVAVQQIVVLSNLLVGDDFGVSVKFSRVKDGGIWPKTNGLYGYMRSLQGLGLMRILTCFDHERNRFPVV